MTEISPVSFYIVLLAIWVLQLASFLVLFAIWARLRARL